MTINLKEVPANSVPAVAVIQEGLALFSMIRRKGYVGVIYNNFIKFYRIIIFNFNLYYHVNYRLKEFLR